MVVGHGTRDPKGTAEFFELVDRLHGRLSDVDGRYVIAAGLLEFQQPTIAEAFEKLRAADVERVDVAPLLLFAAGHAKSDIPDEVAAVADEMPIAFSRPLSRAPELIQCVMRRLGDSLDGQAFAPESTAVLMVGRGSRDPCAKSDMRVLTEVVRSRIHVGHMATAFYAMTDPKVPEVLDELAGRRGVQRIVVYPHLLFHGRLYEAIVRQVEDARSRHPGVRFTVTDYLGPVPAIASALARRIEQIAEPSTTTPSKCSAAL